LTEDVSPHDLVHDFVVTAGGLAVEQSITRRLSGEGKGSEGVHNEVHPEHLDGGEGGIGEQDGAREHDEHGSDVDGKLELQELLDVVEDVATVLNGGFDGAEVVVGEDDVGGVLGNIGSGDAHSEANISSVESGCVVGTVTSHGNSSFLLLEACDEQELVIRGRASQNLELLGDFLEFLQVFDGVDSLIINDFLADTTGGFSKVLANHSNVALFVVSELSCSDNTSLLGDGNGGVNMVTSAHSNVDAGSVAELNGFSDSGSKGINKSEDTDSSEVFLNDSTVLYVLEIVVGALELLPFGFFVVSVSDQQGSVGSVGERLDNRNVDNVILLLLAKFFNSFRALNVFALLDDGVGGSLDVNSNLTTKARESDGSSLSLTLGAEGDGELKESIKISVLLESVGINFGVHQVLKHTLLSHVTNSNLLARFVDLDVSRRVVKHGLSNEFSNRRASQFCVAGSFNDLTLDPHGHNSHLVSGKGTGLVSADLVGTSHGLRGMKTTHHVVLFLHFADGEGKGNRDGEGKSFRHSNDNNSHGDDESIHKVSEVLLVRNFTRVGVEDLDEQSNSHGDEGEYSDVNTKGANLVSDGLEFLLERGQFTLDIQDLGGGSSTGVLTDGKNKTTASSSLDKGRSKQEGVRVG